MKDKGIDLREKWTHLIRLCQGSPLTIKNFAHENKIGVNSLYVWSKRLGLPLKAKTEGDMGFFELGLIPFHGQEDAQSCHVEIEIGDLIMKTEMPWFRMVGLIKEFYKS